MGKEKNTNLIQNFESSGFAESKGFCIPFEDTGKLLLEINLKRIPCL